MKVFKIKPLKLSEEHSNLNVNVFNFSGQDFAKMLIYESYVTVELTIGLIVKRKHFNSYEEAKSYVDSEYQEYVMKHLEPVQLAPQYIQVAQEDVVSDKNYLVDLGRGLWEVLIYIGKGKREYHVNAPSIRRDIEHIDGTCYLREGWHGEDPSEYWDKDVVRGIYALPDAKVQQAKLISEIQQSDQADGLYQDEWISVTDAMPPLDPEDTEGTVAVSIKTDEGEVRDTAYFSAIDDDWYPLEEDWEGTVTHWKTIKQGLCKE